MDTPIFDFVQNYIKSNTARLHMPGHKGVSFLGCEQSDITEIKGADELYAPDGIIRKSEENATRLFDTAKTVYSAGGSSQSINAMLYLAYLRADKSTRPFVLAGEYHIPYKLLKVREYSQLCQDNQDLLYIPQKAFYQGF